MITLSQAKETAEEIAAAFQDFVLQTVAGQIEGHPRAISEFNEAYDMLVVMSRGDRISRATMLNSAGDIQESLKPEPQTLTGPSMTQQFIDSCKRLFLDYCGDDPHGKVVVWRRRPEMDYEFSTDSLKMSMRLHLVDADRPEVIERLKAVEAIQTPKTFDFGEAINSLKGGLVVRRTGWNGAGMWIKLQRPDAHSKMSLPYIYMKTVQGHLVPWLASQTDMLAEDWTVVTD